MLKTFHMNEWLELSAEAKLTLVEWFQRYGIHSPKYVEQCQPFDPKHPVQLLVWPVLGTTVTALTHDDFPWGALHGTQVTH